MLRRPTSNRQSKPDSRNSKETRRPIHISYLSLIPRHFHTDRDAKLATGRDQQANSPGEAGHSAPGAGAGPSAPGRNDPGAGPSATGRNDPGAGPSATGHNDPGAGPSDTGAGAGPSAPGAGAGPSAPGAGAGPHQLRRTRGRCCLQGIRRIYNMNGALVSGRVTIPLQVRRVLVSPAILASKQLWVL